MPVRKIPKNYRNITGIASRGKSIGKAMFESGLERDFITLLEFNREVDSFEVQPISIEWIDSNGKKRSYTPDTLAFYTSNSKKPTLFEVKYRSELKSDWQQLKPKFKAALAYARYKGWAFKIMTEKEIRTPQLENAKFLLPFVNRGPQVEDDMDMVAESLRQIQKATPTLLLNKIYQDEWNKAKLLPTLWYLVGTHQIGANLNQRLTMTSEIWSID
jgi:hypothetical protein